MMHFPHWLPHVKFGALLHRQGQQIMNFTQILQIVEDIIKVYGELKADGTLEKLIAAEQTIAHEATTNPGLQLLIGHVNHLMNPAAAMQAAQHAAAQQQPQALHLVEPPQHTA